MIHKTRQEIINSIVNYITTQYNMISKNDIKADSLISVMVEAIAIEISEMYYDIDRVESQNAVSTANKTYLDLIGNTIGAYRKPGQTDEDYRYQIVNWVRNSRTSSKSAVEKVIQDNSNIYTYSIDNLAYGAGSFSVHVQTKDNSVTESVIAELETAINDVVAEGVYFKVICPKDVHIQITMTISGDLDDSAKALAKTAMRKYITGIQSGHSMYRSNIEAAAIGSSDKVVTAKISSIKIGGKTAYGNEIKLLKDEQFRIDSESIIFEQ